MKYIYLYLVLSALISTPVSAQQTARSSFSIQLQERPGQIGRSRYVNPKAKALRTLMERGQRPGTYEPPTAEDELASYTAHGEINDIVASYYEGGTFHVRAAFRRYIPSQATIEALFKDKGSAATLRDTYLTQYGEYFQTGILDDLQHVDLTRTKVYNMTMGAITPPSLKNDLKDVNYPMLRAEFYYPHDQLALIGTHPVLTIYFVRVNDELKIFHLQALESAQPTKR